MLIKTFFSIPNVAEHEFLMLLTIGFLISEIINFICININNHYNQGDTASDTNPKNGFINLTYDEFMEKKP